MSTEMKTLKITEAEREFVSGFMGEQYPSEIDWNLLMPVVEKIEFELGATITRRKMICEIHYREDEKSFTDIKEEKQPINAVWQIVVSFIQYHNTQTQNKGG